MAPRTNEKAAEDPQGPVSVLGAGTMGRGIAYVCGMSGHEVRVRDIDPEVLSDGAAWIEEMLDGAVERDLLPRAEATTVRERIHTTTDLTTACDNSEFVIEAVPEELELKREVLSNAADAAPDTAVIASNTSSLPLTSLAAAVEDPTRVIGLHFFNPVHAMELVEVITAEQTSERTRQRAVKLVRDLGKTEVVVSDSPGFATSRLGAIQGVEAIRMLDTGVASPRAIDAAMELGYGHPTGPLELTDLVGLDVRLDILEHLRDELGDRFRPPPLLRRKVRAGHLGRKTGEGFYRWEDGEIVGTSEGPDG